MLWVLMSTCRLVIECGLNVFCVPGAVLGAGTPEEELDRAQYEGGKMVRLYWQV